MAGKVTITNATIVKEVPKLAAPVEIASTCDGYVSQTDISFNYVAGACEINAAGNGFTAAGFDGNDGEMILVITTSGLNDGIYTLAADTDAKLTLHADDVVTTETAAAAGTVVVYCVGMYKITPTKATGKLLIRYTEGTVAAGEVGMIPCVLNGSFWVAKNGDYTAFTATAASPGSYYLFIETAPYLQADGTILVMMKPLATKSIYTDHRPELEFIELP